MKINFYKITTVHVFIDFVDSVDPQHLFSFLNLLANNLDTHVAFVVSMDPMRVIVENGREKWLMNVVAQDLSLNAFDVNVESSNHTSELNPYTVVENS
uniref:Uncharacterized protein n=1 Tax=Lactuca sativa TaxID=4236 RepID=A0A9R1WZ87_LACSA|nr:hypothetical protein LSAT_V11C800452820 [Lactuca sativa]